MKKLYDLHTHTTASDGRLTSEELVEKAIEENVSSFALTDHDTVDGIDSAREAAAQLSRSGLEVIAA